MCVVPHQPYGRSVESRDREATMQTHVRHHVGTSGSMTIAGTLFLAAIWALLARPGEFHETLRILGRAVLTGPGWLGS